VHSFTNLPWLKFGLPIERKAGKWQETMKLADKEMGQYCFVALLRGTIWRERKRWMISRVASDDSAQNDLVRTHFGNRARTVPLTYKGIPGYDIKMWPRSALPQYIPTLMVFPYRGL